ncbi:unnamed protein product [Rhizoctonia solani]|uniref:Uncharacterized protein n=1 Tax=Rhizoctonia solani TaxID=456999 RepID=A0A8H3AVC5_9AGAM|nr:unnamed protein product [Rhizoctonia solani]
MYVYFHRIFILHSFNGHAVFILHIDFFQGIHMGIASGSLPVLLRSKLGDDQLGIFSLAAYLGSLKLLWSPIVDSIFSCTFGRRKSWIATTGFASGLLMIWSNAHVQRLMDDVDPDVGALTTIFAPLAFLAASNCIAVDGWAPTLLSVENMPYASAARTIGLNTGYFLSGSSLLFRNKYIRVVPSDLPLLSLGGYLQFWGFATCIATFAFLMLTTEYPVDLDEPYINLRIVCEIMWDICKLEHVKFLFMMQMVAAIGFQVNDTLTSLKLVEKGFSPENLAMATLIHVPAQIIGGWYGALWSRGPLPLRSWFWVLWVRLAFAVATMSLVYMLPNANSLPLSYFWGIVFLIGLNSFIS